MVEQEITVVGQSLNNLMTLDGVSVSICSVNVSVYTCT